MQTCKLLVWYLFPSDIKNYYFLSHVFNSKEFEKRNILIMNAPLLYNKVSTCVYRNALPGIFLMFHFIF